MSLHTAAFLAAVLVTSGAAPRHHAHPAPQTPPAAGTQDSAAAAPADTGQNDGVAAIVNDQIISEYDLQQRMALFAATSGIPATAETFQRIRPQVLQQLETEKLQLLEAQKNNVAVTAADVDGAIESLEKSNNITQDQLKATLARGNVEFASFRAQVAAQLAWQKLVSQQLGDRVHISPEDVTAEMKRTAAGADKPHFLVSEIFLPVDNPDQDGKVLKAAQDLESQLQLGAPFATVARQFSQNPSAAQGGDIGVVQDGQLAAELNDALEKLAPGKFTQPIRSTGGYYILQLRARQEAMGTKIPTKPAATTPDGVLPLARILLPIGPKPAQDLAQKALRAGAVIRSRITTCDQIPALVKELNGAVYMSLGNMRVADLSPQMQQALAQTQPGEPTQPFLSPAGLEIIARCDVAAPQMTAFTMPTRDQVEDQLFEEQITALARQYLRDLRRDAAIQECDAQGCKSPIAAAVSATANAGNATN